jgi:tRNA wybutosine-synthesizing protein 1
VVSHSVDLQIGMDNSLREQLVKQQYYLVGNHSGVKLCHWTKKDLEGEGQCYKHKFYGITSSQCMQVSPALTWCTERCLFCWRSSSYASGDNMDDVEHDAPDWLVKEMIHGQQKLLSGYGGNKKVDRSYWEKAQTPKHVAISLSGEPTLYKHLDDFLEVCHDLDMTTFLVTNGTNPEILESLENLPTQLYLTAAGCTAEMHSAITRPFNPKQAWKNFNRTIDIIADMNTRKVVRMTLVKDKNMFHPEKYAELFFRANGHFLEAKGFVSVGDARNNYGFERMPDMTDIRNFSNEIVTSSNGKLQIIDESESSCAVLISPEDFEWRFLEKID